MTTQFAAYAGEYQGEKAIWLKHGSYEAAVLPEIGANLIVFRELERGLDFLHQPKENEMEEFKANPGIYGIPVLIPPNRFEDGKFPWEGTTYQLPINEEATGNHLHGYIHTLPWIVNDMKADEHESTVVLSHRVSEGHLYKTYFPFEFTVTMRYTLSSSGLLQQVTVRNDGQSRIPNLIAFHTAINAPFVPGSSPDDYKMQVTIGERYELNERSLPTGKKQALNEGELLMKGEGVNPYFESMDNHYTASPKDGRNAMILSDTRTGDRLIYDVGTSYKHWMIWNNGACKQFFCPEPQMNLVNAPNITDIPDEEKGLIGLEPGQIWEEHSRLYHIKG